MIDLDSDPTKLIEIVMIGKQLLDHARRFDDLLDLQRRRQIFRDHPGDVRRILSEPPVLNVMHLHSPESAILSAIIFNALIIIA